MNIQSLKLNKVDGLEMSTYFQPSTNAYFTKEFIIPFESQMRMDNICYELYGNTEYVDFLLYFNDIINPLNIIQDQSIYYVNANIIPGFYAPEEIEETIQNILTNPSKSSKVDKNRIEKSEKSLPPTVNESENKQIKIEGNSIIIGSGIFNV
jgi:hypothetical protein